MDDSLRNSGPAPSVIIVGGGLAGMSAAIALVRQGVSVTLLESRHRLGGRVGSYVDPVSGELIDYCQHVGMACCTNLRQLIDWLDQRELWEIQKELHFYGPDGRHQPLAALPVLPAPLHLASWLWKWPGLTLRDRLSVALGLRSLDRVVIADEAHETSAIQWLLELKQTRLAVERFWKTVVVSALGEELEQVSLGAVAKVFQDGFLRHRDAFHLLVPLRPLTELFGLLAVERLRAAGVNVQLGCTVRSLVRGGRDCLGVELGDGSQWRADHTIVAVPWHRFGPLVERNDDSREPDSWMETALRASQLASSPISGVHTWWDRPWLETPHAVLVGRLCQWVFPRIQQSQTSGEDSSAQGDTEHYYQIVISASRSLSTIKSTARHAANDVDSQSSVDASWSLEQLIHADLAQVFPGVASAKLLRLKAVTDPHAVFSANTRAHRLRPKADALGDTLSLAGDWTATSWPATMESAVLSGFLAAEQILKRYNITICLRAPPL